MRKVFSHLTTTNTFSKFLLEIYRKCKIVVVQLNECSQSEYTHTTMTE